MNKMNKIVLEDSFYKLNLDNEKNYIITSNNNSNAEFSILDNINTKIVEINKNNLISKYTFNILNNSNIEINIFDDSKEVKRIIDININGENSTAILNISSISSGKNEYIINVWCNKSGSTSEANIHSVTNGDSKIIITNNGYIRNGAKKSKLSQDNKIITIGENNSKIEPNLYIDEYDIEASHGAYIGKFDYETLFYLKSRGLDETLGYNLLIKGFLLDSFYKYESLMQDLINIINKYWR